MSEILRYSVTTDGYPRKGAIALWQQALSALVDVCATATSESSDFNASATIYHLGSALLIVMRSDAIRYTRSLCKAQRDDLDHHLLHMPRSGRSIFAASHASRALRRMDVAIADLSCSLDIDSQAGVSVSLILPRSRLLPLLASADNLHGRFLDGTTPAGALLGRHMLTLARHVPSVRTDDARAYVDATARLAAACLSAEPKRDAAPPVSAARRGLSVQARDYIERNLGDPRLGPDRLADALHISRSRLYRLFEAAGGVHKHIQLRRLRRAFEMITGNQAEPLRIGEIAYSVGFTDEAHFSRVFRARFGQSPRAARAAARCGEGPVPVALADVNPLDRWLRELSLA